MKPIKIAFFDIDGTVVDMNKKQISEKMLETLERLKKNNVIICMATGRTPMTLPDFKDIFDVFLTFNGSYCFNRQQTIFTNPLDTKDVQKIIKNATLIHRPVSVATKERLGANGRDKDLIDYYALANLEVDVDENFESLVKDEIFQIMMGGRKDEYAQIMEGVEHARITAWWDRAVDIIPADGGKGKGIEKVLEFYHIRREDAVAFGDGNNDIEMLQTIGLGVAMGNASEELKTVADDICGDVGEDGIYYYCIEQGWI